MMEGKYVHVGALVFQCDKVSRSSYTGCILPQFVLDSNMDAHFHMEKQIDTGNM